MLIDNKLAGRESRVKMRDFIFGLDIEKKIGKKKYRKIVGLIDIFKLINLQVKFKFLQEMWFSKEK